MYLMMSINCNAHLIRNIHEWCRRCLGIYRFPVGELYYGRIMKMKKYNLVCAAFVLMAAMLVACGNSSGAETAATEAPVPEQTTVPNEMEGEEDVVYEGDASTYYIDVAYPEQIGRYYTALSEKWEEGKYFENCLSALPSYYYEGNPLENVGFGFVDLDNDGRWELIIGAIMNAEVDPAVFEIWTLVDGEPVMLAQGGSRNRYVLQYVEEDRMWYVVNEASNGAANSATYYLMLNEGEFEVVQGIVLDALADEENPWFLTYDLYWDVSNDQPIDEETASAILESNRKIYTALELFPYIYY